MCPLLFVILNLPLLLVYCEYTMVSLCVFQPPQVANNKSTCANASVVSSSYTTRAKFLKTIQQSSTIKIQT